MSTAIDKFDEGMRRRADRVGMTTVHRGELLRHPVYTRLLHWLVAIAFVLSLLSGFALYSPWLFRFLTPIFGGGPMARFLHPWFGLFFDIFFLFQFLNWCGQKLYFWSIVLSGVLFIVTGLLMWFDHVVPRWIVAVSYVVHDLAALLMLAGFIIHIYEGTAAMPGTFRAMTNGTVTRKWAWTHHPAWYRDVTGRDPREDYEREKRGQAERQRVIEEREREGEF